MPEALLDVRGLVSGYGSGTVLHALSLKIGPAQRVGLMGRNGTGKTTLLRTLMGLLPARAGSMCFDGVEFAARPTHQRSRLGLGYIPQGRQLFADLSIEQNLLVAGIAHGHEDLAGAWTLFPWLKERRGERAGNLSGGQQQQLALARALMTRPRLLLLDEPFEGVQPSLVSEIIDALERHCRAHETALLLVEQDVDAATALCERVAFLERGAVAKLADVDTLSQRPDLIERYLGI